MTGFTKPSGPADPTASIVHHLAALDAHYARQGCRLSEVLLPTDEFDRLCHEVGAAAVTDPSGAVLFAGRTGEVRVVRSPEAPSLMQVLARL